MRTELAVTGKQQEKEEPLNPDNYDKYLFRAIRKLGDERGFAALTDQEGAAMIVACRLDQERRMRERMCSGCKHAWDWHKEYDCVGDAGLGNPCKCERKLGDG